jgi:hypothetical protein
VIVTIGMTRISPRVRVHLNQKAEPLCARGTCSLTHRIAVGDNASVGVLGLGHDRLKQQCVIATLPAGPECHSLVAGVIDSVEPEAYESVSCSVDHRFRNEVASADQASREWL